MKLTLDPDHQIAQAIRAATMDSGNVGHVTLSVETFDRNWHRTSRPLRVHVDRWSLHLTGRHSTNPDHVFECEFIDNDDYLRRFLLPYLPVPIQDPHA